MCFVIIGALYVVDAGPFGPSLPLHVGSSVSRDRRKSYPPDPDTMTSSRLDSIRPSSVQTAPSAVQSVVMGNTTVTLPLEVGLIFICQPMLLGGFRRRAPVTDPPVTVKA